jgi:hypothetical protein
MLIDKTKFLALVAAISTASAACIIVDDDDGDGLGGDNVGAGDEGAGNQGAGNQGGDGAGGDGTGGTGGGADCLGDSGNPAACDSTCEGFTNCNGVANLKEGVEEEMVACMNALDPVSCSFEQDVLNGCYFNAASQACVDPNSDTACAAAAPACGTENDTMWLGECAAYMDGLNASGQALFEACLSDTCTGGTPAADATTFCVYDVIFPTG